MHVEPRRRVDFGVVQLLHKMVEGRRLGQAQCPAQQLVGGMWTVQEGLELELAEAATGQFAGVIVMSQPEPLCPLLKLQRPS